MIETVEKQMEKLINELIGLTAQMNYFDILRDIRNISSAFYWY